MSKSYFGFTVEDVPRYVYHPDKEKNKFKLANPELREKCKKEYVWFDEMREDSQKISDEVTGEQDLRFMLDEIKEYRGKNLVRRLLDKLFEWHNILTIKRRINKFTAKIEESRVIKPATIA